MLARKQDPRVQVAERSEAAKPKSTAAALLTVTGEEAKIEGKFRIADSLHIECEIGGELDIGGKLVIGERGVVHADVRTVDALIMGTYEGNMVATGDVEIAATGRVTGNLHTDSLVIDKGGFFNGTVAKLEGGAEQRSAAVVGNGLAVHESTRTAEVNGNGAAEPKGSGDQAKNGVHRSPAPALPEEAAFLVEAPGAGRD